MLKLIVWSKDSEDDILKLIDYLLLNWGSKFADDYVKSIEKIIFQISVFPKLYPIIYNKLKIRKCVVSKHNTIYYRGKKGFVEIINIYDTRQNPRKIKFKR